MFYANRRMRVKKDVVTRITRTLNGSGTLNVQIGQELSPDYILGSGEVYGGYRAINVASILGVSSRETESLLQKRVGERIYRGELLALRGQSFLRPQKTLTSPTDAIIDSINSQTGEVQLKLLPKKLDFPAAVFGIVEGIDQTRGQVVIKTQVSQIFGVFGSGRVRGGILEIISGRDQMVWQKSINPHFADKVLVTGSLIHRDALSEAVTSGVSGIITGGLNAEDLKGMAGGRIKFPSKIGSDIGLSIVVCEGFGILPIGQDIFEILTSHNQKFVIIDGNRGVINLPSYDQSSLAKIKTTHLPEIGRDILTEDQPIEVADVTIGQTVRVIANPYMGEQGTLISVDQSSTVLSSGMTTFLVTLETRTKKIKVPVTNIEII